MDDDGKEKSGEASTAPQDVDSRRKMLDLATLASGKIPKPQSVAIVEQTARALATRPFGVDDYFKSTGADAKLRVIALGVSGSMAMQELTRTSALHQQIFGTSRSAHEALFGLSRRSLIDDALGANLKFLSMPNSIAAIAGIDRNITKAIGASGVLAATARLSATSELFKIQPSIERAFRDIAGLGSLKGLVFGARMDGSRTARELSEIIGGATKWREMAMPHAALLSQMTRDWPGIFPERKLPSAMDIASAQLGPLAERLAGRTSNFDRIRDEMLRIRTPWVDAEEPSRSIAAYAEAKALVQVISEGRPESRRVVQAVRNELGDLRKTDPVSDEIAFDPVLRTAFRLEMGFDSDLSSLPPAILVSIFSSLGFVPARISDADEDALEILIHKSARKLELRFRAFIEERLTALVGSNWYKERVDGKTLARWRERKQIDIDNQRKPSRLFDYAGFEDYREIIEREDNWREVFAPIFIVKTSALEALRRLSLIRNPAAHFRVLTIEDLIDLSSEGRRLHRWMDDAKQEASRH